MIDYLQTLDPKEVVCFIDGYDVILLQPLSELERKFKKVSSQTRCKIVVAHEAKMPVLYKLAGKALFGTCNNLSINAGTYIGFAGDLLDVIRSAYALNPQHTSDDQELLTSFCTLSPSDVCVDTNGELFLTVVEHPFTNAKDGKAVLASKANPCIFHGPGCLDMTGVLEYLGYDLTENEKEEIAAYHKNTYMKKSGHYTLILLGHSLPCIALALVAYMMFFRTRNRISA